MTARKRAADDKAAAKVHSRPSNEQLIGQPAEVWIRENREGRSLETIIAEMTEDDKLMG